MSQMLHARPVVVGRAALRRLPWVLVVLALVAVVLPVTAIQAAATTSHHRVTAREREQATKARRVAHRRAVHAREVAQRQAAHRRAELRRARARLARLAKARKARADYLSGRPPKGYVIPDGAYFSFPNRSRADGRAIRDRVLRSIRSVWGGPHNRLGAYPGNGTIRMATWSFDDWDVAKALVAARNRGVSVQVVAAKAANKDEHDAWHWLRKKLGANLYRPGYPTTRERVSFARQCAGSCRGPGGTPHSKYFLFDDVGRTHRRHVVVQTSMNLTSMAYTGQWNQAQVMRSAHVYADFLGIFEQTRLGRPVSSAYHTAKFGNVVDYFFPSFGATASTDPVMQMLDHVDCRGATVGGTAHGMTRIRIIQYAMYGDRGVWIAKKLRSLWSQGCDIGIIYSVSSRPVLGILRNKSGRGAVPMKQSVVKDGWGNIVKYNHSKWMTITGHWGASTAAAITFAGSANWANLAFGDDEQMQRVSGAANAARYVATYNKTWRQKSSTAPTPGTITTFGRTGEGARLDEPAEAPEFGTGVFRYMTED